MEPAAAAPPAVPPPAVVYVNGEEVITGQPPMLTDTEEVTDSYETCRLKIESLTRQQYKAENHAEVLTETAF